MYYSDSHEWIKIKGDTGKIGISNHALKELGEIVYIQFPKVGCQVKAGEEIAVLESNKAAADIYSPVSGVVISLNKQLEEDISLINKFPEKEGYLFEIVIHDSEELKKLFSKGAYEKSILI